jgi:hypothetical protein
MPLKVQRQGRTQVRKGVTISGGHILARGGVLACLMHGLAEGAGWSWSVHQILLPCYAAVHRGQLTFVCSLTT